MPASEPFLPSMPTRTRPAPDYAQPQPPPPEPRAPAPAPQGGPAELLRKMELEAAMLAAPQDQALRAAYFDHVGRIAIAHTGLQTVVLPDIGPPLYFRCGTPDIAVLANVFRDNAMAFEMKPTPLRILVIGAYAGYSTIDLARRFPRAQIVAAEPLADNFRLLALNTGAWRRIRCANVALWHHAARLAPALRFQADWAVRMHDEAEEADRTVQAISVKDLLGRIGWQGPDLVVCDASGAEREVFADPLAPWLNVLDAALVRLHEQVAPHATEWVNAALEPRVFEHSRVGDMELYVRRVPRQALPPIPPELPLLRADPGLTPFALDVPVASFGFFVYDGNNCQIHPGPLGGKPSRAVFTVRATGQRRFVAGVLHAGRPASPITFTAAVQREDGSLAGRGEVVMKQRETGRLLIDLGEPVAGTVRVALQTAMAPGAANANMAWARWLDPKLV
jgi:FkbM family methyltransferase